MFGIFRADEDALREQKKKKMLKKKQRAKVRSPVVVFVPDFQWLKRPLFFRMLNFIKYIVHVDTDG